MGGAVPLIRDKLLKGKETPAVTVLKQCTEVYLLFNLSFR